MRETEDNISATDNHVLVSSCTFYNKRTHYPMLEKPSAQNITACENQGKPRKLSDHWKYKKRTKTVIFDKGITQKKTKRMTEIKLLTKSLPKESLRKQK